MSEFKTRRRDKQVFPTSKGKEYRKKDDYNKSCPVCGSNSHTLCNKRRQYTDEDVRFIEDMCHDVHGKSFSELTESQQKEVLKEFDGMKKNSIKAKQESEKEQEDYKPLFPDKVYKRENLPKTPISDILLKQKHFVATEGDTIFVYDDTSHRWKKGTVVDLKTEPMKSGGFMEVYTVNTKGKTSDYYPHEVEVR